MGHLTTRDVYKNLEERINWFTQGAPPSETLYKILTSAVYGKRSKVGGTSSGASVYFEKGGKNMGYNRGKGGEALGSFV